MENHRIVTFKNIKYGILVEVLDDHGSGYHAGCKVHFFNKKGVLVGNYYKFIPYERLKFREPYPINTRNPRPYDGKKRDYPRYFMGKPFERIKRSLFIQILKVTTILIKWTQKIMQGDDLV